METLQTTTTKSDIKSLVNSENVKQKFKEMLGKKSAGFLVSLLNITQSNDLLAKAEPNSIIFSAATAASLDLPIDPNLGFAYILPYNKKQKDGTFKNLATFQLGYKGFIQLALRSGQFKTISSAPIYEGQLIEENPLTGFVFDFKQKKSEKIIGYASYFELINGFNKTFYMNADEVKAHGMKFSQTFKKGYGLWKDDFNSMALKTVTKLNLSKYAPLSIEMQKAILTDQSVVNDFEASSVEYVDNEVEVLDVEAVSDQKERERVLEWINKAQDLTELSMLQSRCDTPDLVEAYDVKYETLKTK